MKVMVKTWDDFEEAAKKLAEKIKTSNRRITSVTGIPRGGLPLAVKLSHLLGIPYVRYPVYQVQADVLVCDEIVDFGRTLKFHRDKVCHPKTSFASWMIKSHTKYKPDFFVEKVSKDVWVVFPWENVNENRRSKK